MDLANIELDRHRTSQLLTFLVIAIGTLVLIFALGQWIGRFQVNNLYWMFIATIAAAMFFGLQRRVWILLVAAWPYAARRHRLLLAVGREFFQYLPRVGEHCFIWH